MKSYEDSLLLDFYGNLLTEKMRLTLDMYLNDDLSLAEIAEEEEISRQGVHDTVKRGLKQLNGYEDKLGLVKRFLEQRESVKEAIDLIDSKEYEDARKVLSKLSEEIEE
ncbi:MAG: putative DNA-binding protein [Clostridiales bacterium]|nr:putative DNA-binding protein [Clostridiales bacterium]